MSTDTNETEFLTHIVKGIVDKPESVEVRQEVDKQGIKLTLSVDQSDMGKVVGAKGRMAIALRTIMHAYGGQHESHVSVLIEEPDNR